MAEYTPLYSLTKVLANRLLRVPDYQRGYAWTEKQVQDFWGDIEQLAPNSKHYAGVLTLELVPREISANWLEDTWLIDAKGYEAYFVVDGQQRLTTSVILIKAILDKVKEGETLNFEDRESLARKFIAETKPNSSVCSYLFDYACENPSFDYLRMQIYGEKYAEGYEFADTVYTNNLRAAKEFFEKKLERLTPKELELIFRKISQQFLFAIYSISHEVDVQVAFETMNNRGKPLSHLELLKNRLIYLSAKFDVDNTERKVLRKKINDAWKDIYDYLGRNSNRRLDDDKFLVNHYVSYFDDEKADPSPRACSRLERIASGQYAQHLLERKFLLKNIVNHNQAKSHTSISMQDVHEYAESLQTAVIAWHGIQQPMRSQYGEEEKTWLEKINRLQSWPAAPLLLVAFQHKKNGNDRLLMLQSIEKLLFCATVIGYFRHIFTEDEDFLVPMAHQLFRKKISIETVSKHIAGKTVEISQLISTRMIQVYKLRGFYDWVGLRYFLYEYEVYLREKSRTQRAKVDWETLNSLDDTQLDYKTVEHILPQKLPKASEWSKVFSVYTDKEKALLKDSLGNLVPLSRSKNSSLSNNSFAKKVDSGGNVGFRYGGYSENELTRHSKWGGLEILIRGIVLLNFMESRWDIKLGNISQKISFLGLEFVLKKEKVTESTIETSVAEWTHAKELLDVSKKTPLRRVPNSGDQPKRKSKK